MLQKQMVRITSWVIVAVLLLLPLHAFLTTWAGTIFGGLDIWRIWKELAIVAIVPVGAYLALTSPVYVRWLKTSWLPRLIAAYIVLYLLAGVFALHAHQVNAEALVYSWLSNLRFVGFFLVVSAVAVRTPVLRRLAPKLVLGTGILVVLFGLLQLVLPIEFLAQFGYGPDTIPAYHTVDNKLDYQRIQSTLRGPNPFGAYLVVLFGLFVAWWRLKRQPFDWRLIAAAVGLTAALLFSYSRSAYIGAAVAVSVIVYAALRPAVRRYFGWVAAVVVVLSVCGLLALRNNNLVQNTVFHSDETSRSAISSNTGRSAALQQGIHDVATEPFGRGPGTAGPASTRNDHPVRIAENYYLQIGQEVGWLGIGLFAAINICVGAVLWRHRRDWFALGLFASLIGLTVVNLVSHAWADDTLGLLWWGLAGIAVASGILHSNEQNQNKVYKTHEIPVQKTPKKRQARS